MSGLKKTPSSIETDELLDLLKETDPTAEDPESIGLNYTNDVLTFLSVFKIEPGEDQIKAHTLYSIYKVWSKNAITKQEFHNEVKKFLPGASIQNKAGYKINQNAIKLTHIAYSRFKKERERLKSKLWTKHFEDFLLFHALKSDNFWIESDILYFLYDKYTYERGLDSNANNYMGREIFFIYADIFLKHKITKTGKVYAVSENIKNFFQKDQLERMQVTYVKEEKKKNKKRKSKLSRS